jgi:hypothetical protein
MRLGGLESRAVEWLVEFSVGSGVVKRGTRSTDDRARVEGDVCLVPEGT